MGSGASAALASATQASPREDLQAFFASMTPETRQKVQEALEIGVCGTDLGGTADMACSTLKTSQSLAGSWVFLVGRVHIPTNEAARFDDPATLGFHVCSLLQPCREQPVVEIVESIELVGLACTFGICKYVARCVRPPHDDGEDSKLWERDAEQLLERRTITFRAEVLGGGALLWRDDANNQQRVWFPVGRGVEQSCVNVCPEAADRRIQILNWYASALRTHLANLEWASVREQLQLVAREVDSACGHLKRAPKKCRTSSLYLETVQTMEALQELIPLLIEVSKPTFCERHWLKVSELLDLPFDRELPMISVYDLLSANLSQSLDEIYLICEDANKEECAHGHVCRIRAEYAYLPSPKTHAQLVDTLDRLQEWIDALSTSAMRKHSKPFREEFFDLGLRVGAALRFCLKLHSTWQKYSTLRALLHHHPEVAEVLPYELPLVNHERANDLDLLATLGLTEDATLLEELVLEDGCLEASRAKLVANEIAEFKRQVDLQFDLTDEVIEILLELAPRLLPDRCRNIMGTGAVQLHREFRGEATGRAVLLEIQPIVERRGDWLSTGRGVGFVKGGWFSLKGLGFGFMTAEFSDLAELARRFQDAPCLEVAGDWVALGRFLPLLRGLRWLSLNAALEEDADCISALVRSLGDLELPIEELEVHGPVFLEPGGIAEGLTALLRRCPALHALRLVKVALANVNFDVAALPRLRELDLDSQLMDSGDLARLLGPLGDSLNSLRISDCCIAGFDDVRLGATQELVVQSCADLRGIGALMARCPGLRRLNFKAVTEGQWWDVGGLTTGLNGQLLLDLQDVCFSTDRFRAPLQLPQGKTLGEFLGRHCLRLPQIALSDAPHVIAGTWNSEQDPASWIAEVTESFSQLPGKVITVLRDQLVARCLDLTGLEFAALAFDEHTRCREFRRYLAEATRQARLELVDRKGRLLTEQDDAAKLIDILSNS